MPKKQPAIDDNFVQLIAAVHTRESYVLSCQNCVKQLESEFPERSTTELAVRAYNVGWRYGDLQFPKVFVRGPLCPKCAKKITNRHPRQKNPRP